MLRDFAAKQVFRCIMAPDRTFLKKWFYVLKKGLLVGLFKGMGCHYVVIDWIVQHCNLLVPFTGRDLLWTRER